MKDDTKAKKPPKYKNRERNFVHNGIANRLGIDML